MASGRRQGVVKVYHSSAGDDGQHQHLMKYELLSINVYTMSLSKREEGLQRVVRETSTATALLKESWHALRLLTTQCGTCWRKRVIW